MPIDERISNKSSEEMTREDVKTVLKSPKEGEKPLVDAGIFEEKQPAVAIYKSIPLKTALASLIALVLMVPIMGFFSGNLRAGSSSETVASSEETEIAETEEEKEQRLMAEENANLKRELALQNQSFTAKEIEDAEDVDGEVSEELQPVATAPSTLQRPAPVSRPVAAVAPRPAPTPRPAPVARTVRPTPAPRAATPARTASIPVARASARPVEPKPVNLAQLAAAGNYGQMPNRAMPSPDEIAVQPVSSSGQIPTGVMVASRTTEIVRSGSIPISVRRQGVSPTVDVSEAPESVKRPLPMVMRDAALDVAPVVAKRPLPTVMQDGDRSKAVAAAKHKSVLVAQTNIEPDEASTYEAQRQLIMGGSAPTQASAPTGQNLPSRIMPGSAANLEVTTAVTWASDLPKALGSVTLTSPLISDGVEIIPASTELIVQIGDLSSSGAVALDVVAMVLPGSADATKISIPEGAVAVLAVDGGYPVATAEQSSERQLRAIDRQQALLSAMGAAGDFLNRPERETSVIGIGGSSSSREYGSGSILGSLLSGAANGMLRSRAARLNTEAEKLIERPTIWSLEPGRQLQLFVTQEISL